MPERRLVGRLDQKCQQILVINPLGKLLQERSKRNRRAEALKISFASGFVSQLGKIILPLVDPPKGMAEMAGSRGVDGVNLRPRLLSGLNGLNTIAKDKEERLDLRIFLPAEILGNKL